MRVSADLGVGYEEVRSPVSHNLDVLDEVSEPGPGSLGSLGLGNVFVKDGKITGITDFERALWGDFDGTLFPHDYGAQKAGGIFERIWQDRVFGS